MPSRGLGDPSLVSPCARHALRGGQWYRRAVRFDALLFDLDGTLIDSRADIARACNAALVASGREALAPSYVATLVGDGARVLLARATQTLPDDPLVEELYPTFEREYLANPTEGSFLLDHVATTLVELAHLPLAVCTNKPRAITLAVLEGLGVLSAFRAVVCPEDVARHKPAPDMLLEACVRIGIPPSSRVAMVGDSAVDIVAGRAAGLTTVGVLGPFGKHEALREGAPDALLSSFAELATYVS